MPPLSDAHVNVVPSHDDIIIQDEEFYVAITLSQLESSGIQMPLVVAKVNESNWKRNQWDTVDGDRAKVWYYNLIIANKILNFNV